MYSRRPARWAPTVGGFGGPVPRDLLVLIGILFGTFALQFFATTAPLIALLRLTDLVWHGFVWQLATYPFIGWGGPSPWILLELLILYWFGRDVFWQLGRRDFWQLVGWTVVLAAVAAVLAELLFGLLLGWTANSFLIMQGQRMLLAVMIAAFATMNRSATIYLFFVLPVQARWFLALEIAFAFIAFLGTRDLAGFVGIASAVGLTYSFLTPGGLRRVLREGSLRAQKAWIQLQLKQAGRRRKAGDSDDDNVRRGPWVH